MNWKELIKPNKNKITYSFLSLLALTIINFILE